MGDLDRGGTALGSGAGATGRLGAPARAAVLLAVLALAALGRVPFTDFVRYDDGVYVVNNPVVLQGLTLEGAAWAFTTTNASNWHPLTWLSSKYCQYRFC